MQKDKGLMRSLTGSGVAASSTRRLLIAALTVPLAGAALAVMFQRAGTTTPAEGYALVATVSAALFIAVIGVMCARWEDLERTGRDVSVALQNAQSHMAAVVENASDAIVTKDLTGRVLSWNQAAERIFGFTAAQMVGQSISRLIPPERLQEENRILERIRRGERVESFDTERVHRDGHRVLVSVTVSPVKDTQGQIVAASKVARDVTHQREAEKRIRESEARFRSLADNLQQLIWTTDPRGQCDYVNEQWVQFTGVSAEQLKGGGWLAFVHPEDAEDLHRAWQAALEAARGFTHEFRLRRHDGQYRWVISRGHLMLDEAEGLRRWCGVTTDIEVLKRSQLAQLRTQKMEALGTLAGGIAHDFNNILLAISGNTRMALDDLPSDHPARPSLVEVDKASQRAVDLVHRILAFSRAEEPQTEVQYLQPLVEEALKLLRPTVPAQIQIRVHVEPGVPAIQCDSGQIHQTLMNLITKATHAIEDKVGTVDIWLTRVLIGEDQVAGGLARGEYVCLSVEDDGCGMTLEMQQRIFDPFFTTKVTGTGLGLSVVEGIMKSHRGAVTVYSEPHKGSCFRLYFPASAQPPASTSRRPGLSPIVPRPAGQRIMYVDDDPALVLLTTRRLTRLGYSISGETNPTAALAHFRENPHEFDAVITDLSMPEMPGFELARAMLAQRPDLPIIATSGFVRPEDQDQAQQIGIRSLILKPGSEEELTRALAAALQDRGRTAVTVPHLRLI